MSVSVSDFLAMSEGERRAMIADLCATKSDEEMAKDLLSFFLAIPDDMPTAPLLGQLSRIIGDIRAGERLRLSRLQ